MSLKIVLEEVREKTAESLKEALLPQLVRYAATDVPGTKKLRLFMRHRSPEELAGIQHTVEGAFKKVEDPVKRVVHGAIDKVPHEGVKKVLKGGANMLIENPETIPMQAVPIPGLTPAYMLAKKGLEKGLDRISPLHKAAFATNAFSGPMNPIIESGASYQGAGRITPLKNPNAQPKLAGAWASHAALNLGQAARDVRYATDHPAADKVAPRGTLKHRAASAVARAPSLAGNLYYAALPPGLHHSKKEMEEIKKDPRKLKEIFLEGYAPWDHGPKKEKKAFKLQGEMDHQGLDIAIENRKGSVRSGTTDDGKKWRTVMKLPYGYIRDTKGADGEDIDCYVGPDKDAPNAYVVHQHKPDGTGYDEDKIMLGMGSMEEARKAYLAHYDDKKFLGPMKEVPMERLKELLESGKKLTKISASAPTRGGFMMASDQNAGPITPLFKGGDILPEEVTYSSGDFKPAKLMKKADISPTQPLGNGGGNPHRAASDQGRMPINPIFNPLQKRAEDGGGAEFGGQYYGGGGAMNPVYNMGFKQTSLQGRGRINPIKKEAFATPAGALASSRRLGTAPGALGAKGPSIHQISGVAGGPSLPGAIKPSSGFGEYRGKMQR